MSYPTSAEQDAWVEKAKAEGRLFPCKGTKNHSLISPATCKRRQKERTTYRYRPDKAFAGDFLYLECKGCTENKTPNRIRRFNNGAWRKTKRCEDRIDTWARAEGFTSTLEAVLLLSRDIWYREIAEMCGISTCFLFRWLKNRQIPLRSRANTVRLMRKNLRMQRRRNDKRSISKKNRRAIRQA